MRGKELHAESLVENGREDDNDNAEGGSMFYGEECLVVHSNVPDSNLDEDI